MENRKVYYDKNYNRFFGVIKKYPRTYLTTGLHGYYDTAKSGDTTRYSIPKSYLKNCILVENPNNEFSEMSYSILDHTPMSYKIKDYDCIHGHEPEIDKSIFKYNQFQSKIVQYQWDKQNDFWAFNKEMAKISADNWPDMDDDYDQLDQEFNERAQY